MLRRSNKRKNKFDEPTNNGPKSIKAQEEMGLQQEPKKPVMEPEITRETISREEFFAQDEKGRKMLEELKNLRQSVDSLKQTDISKEYTDSRAVTDFAQIRGDKTSAGKSMYLEETEEIIAARQAIFEQVQKDAIEKKAKQEELRRNELRARQEQQRLLESERRAAILAQEAEKKRIEAEEAHRLAKEMARKKALESMEAERRFKEDADSRRAKVAMAERRAILKANETPALKQEKELSPAEEKLRKIKNEAGVEAAKQALIFAQKEQEAELEMISHAADVHTDKLAEEQKRRLDRQAFLIKQEQQKLNSMLEDFRATQEKSAERNRAVRELHKQKNIVDKLIREQNAHVAKADKIAKAKADKEARHAKAQADKEARHEKALAEREERKARIKQKRQERRRKAEERELIKKAKRDEAARARLEQLRLEAKSIADAELGGGIVNVKGVTVNTELKDTVHISWKDYFGLKDKMEKAAATEKEKQELKEEREKRTEEARTLVNISMDARRRKFNQSGFFKKVQRIEQFCDKHRKPLLAAFAAVFIVLVGTAGVFNYYTAYSYSYNGKELGIVKNKDDVLRITDLVQNALTQEKEVDVVIDARDDIKFERVMISSDDVTDTSEDVLKKLTYMDNLNVEASCIYINGKKVGAVENDKVARKVMQDIKDKYVSDMEGAKVESAAFIEKVEVKRSNTDLGDISTEEEMVDILCTSAEREIVHDVVIGETLADIAKLYSANEKDILKNNPNINRKKLEVGSKIVIKQNAPILTVKIVEKVTYDKVVPFEVEETDSEDIYEGYTELAQKGEDGLSELTSRITLVNGEQIDEKVLKTKVNKEPVTEKILVGIKERPPSVGSGKYIWPLNGNYTFNSAFKWRWGRQHEGIDLGCTPGTDVIAADGGVVTYAGYSGGYGYLIKIDHQNGMESRYAHNSKLLVSQGEKVFQGQHIAESGNTGRSTGAHLHFEIRVNGTAQNPMNYLP